MKVKVNTKYRLLHHAIWMQLTQMELLEKLLIEKFKYNGKKKEKIDTRLLADSFVEDLKYHKMMITEQLIQGLFDQTILWGLRVLFNDFQKDVIQLNKQLLGSNKHYELWKITTSVEDQISKVELLIMEASKKR